MFLSRAVMKLSIIIPVFNEEKTIAKILDAVVGVLIPSITKEIILIDDGSTDKTKQEITTIQKKYPELILLAHTENKGKGAAVRTALQKATGEYILIQDADLEYNPQEIKILIEQVKDPHVDVVYGTRLYRLPHVRGEERTIRFLAHFFGNRFLSLLTSLMYGQWLTDMETCYKLFPKKAVDGMILRAKGFDFEPEITAKFLKRGYHIQEVPITANPRGYKEGKKLRTFPDGTKALWTILKYRFVD